ncbi:hypothetical protein SAMN04487969_14155 [Paenibacillus algorifonticola]|uniref:Uncharacterized protein n=1 Tax=Paenibacillus algorifonticola TaxID=684063 RepID=A0A1I2IYC9_9BACL|nr:hypothetical protein [Paenibacillus algorifonticola]SFF45491.1 hypothetical protein SAMN04487969_14155 [Paenibacillus algorifonticola]
MSMSLIEQIIILDERDELDNIRALLLIYTLIGNKNDKITIELVKLAKMDFLLKYPSALDSVLTNLNKKKDIHITEAEMNNIETNILSFRFSPWSSNFRKLMVLLNAKSLIDWKLREKSLDIYQTSKGLSLYNDILSFGEFKNMHIQSKAIKTNILALSTIKLDSLLSTALTELTLR